ncbi:MAG: response regulator transcription factor [Bacteroidetes bacterium]|nr:response regulator transcription factor [Bacteroidota bacterium]MCW5896829.1 response regulator transcription factor [Bacteroidota bacterium]
MTIKISIIDDDDSFRRGIAKLINGARGFKCVSEYPDCESALRNIARDKPDVILLDIGFDKPGQRQHMTGVDAVAMFKERLSAAEVIMLTVHEENENVFESLTRGATGYLLKSAGREELLDGISEAVDGGAPMSPTIARKVIRHFQKAPPPEPLTTRENEVLTLLDQGNSYKAIADKLFIAKNTVKFHIRNIYRKMQSR